MNTTGEYTTGPAGVAPSAPILTGTQLVKTYGGTYALAGVDIAVFAGESVAIMGASGSGKTTLLHTLAGIITPEAGTVTLLAPHGLVRVNELGETERSRLRREAFGFVFQQGLLIPELTAVENVALPLMLAGYPRREAEGRAQHWLAVLGLAGLESRRIGELSGGQAQRVAIGRAQVTGATVVFADEPTGALDSATSVDVMTALLESTTGQGHSLVLVTHDEQVAARCSRIVRLRDGRVEADAAHTTSVPVAGGVRVPDMPAPPQNPLNVQGAQTPQGGARW
ncbi:ABC transporter ATP-binding protein [Okibacterium endophyticum]